MIYLITGGESCQIFCENIFLGLNSSLSPTGGKLYSKYYEISGTSDDAVVQSGLENLANDMPSSGSSNVVLTIFRTGAWAFKGVAYVRNKRVYAILTKDNTGTAIEYILDGTTFIKKDAIGELNSKITIVHATKTVNSGFVRVDWPSGVSMSTHMIVITPLYGGITGWSYSVQPSSADIVVYVRIGSERPADGTQIAFDAVFIKL